MADSTPHSGKVHRKGAASERKRDHQHKKKGCHSAPAVPANVELRFRKRNEDHKPVWRGIVKFDPVSLDVAARPLEPERYEVELRAVDASGDPVETHGQEVSTTADGADFTVDSGSTTVVGKGRRLETTGTKIKKTLTGLTTGIEFGVDCYARKSVANADSLVHFAIWDTVLGTEVVQKNGTPDTIKPKVVATLKHTPVAGHGYEIRATYQSGSVGKPIIDQAQWHDNGDAAVWRHRLAGDADPLKEAFPDLAKPKVWYYSARCRAMNRVGGARCYSAWSVWTAPANPVTGDPIGPPAPDGLALTFHRREARKKGHPFQAKAEWNELPWWIPPDGEPVEGADRYAVRLDVSDDGGSTIVRTRRVGMQAKDDDADQTAFYEFNNISRKRHYRFSVRAIKDDRRGAWSAWSAWKSPKTDIGNGPNNPQNVTVTKVKPGHFRVTWDEPVNAEDVDYYRVRVYSLGNLKETVRVRSQHFRYTVPTADRGTAHTFKVTAVDEDDNMSGEQSPADQNDDPDTTVAQYPPNQPSNPSLTFDGRGTRHAIHRAIVTAGTSAVDSNHDAPHRYVIQLAHASTDTGASPPAGTRRKHGNVEGDATGDDLQEVFRNIPKRHHVWCRERARNAAGASSWTTWVHATRPIDTGVAVAPNAPTNVQVTTPAPRRVKVTWDEPDDDETVRWRVVILHSGNPVETGYTRSTRYIYHVPENHVGDPHRARVYAISDTGTDSSQQDSLDGYPTGEITGGAEEGWDIGDVRKLSHVSINNWINNHPKWKRAGGQAMDTATYAALFAEIGYTYGGSGSTFYLPDLNGRHSVGTSVNNVVGANDGDAEANRVLVHAHANDNSQTSPLQDATSVGTPGDYTESGLAGDATAQPVDADYTPENRSHSHETGFWTGSANGTAINAVGGGGNEASRIVHEHYVQGYVGARDLDHDHQGHRHGAGHGHSHGHGGHGHNHGHGGHGHGHNHGGHGHGHGHDQKKRPHLAVWYVIKVLP